MINHDLGREECVSPEVRRKRMWVGLGWGLAGERGERREGRKVEGRLMVGRRALAHANLGRRVAFSSFASFWNGGRIKKIDRATSAEHFPEAKIKT